MADMDVPSDLRPPAPAIGYNLRRRIEPGRNLAKSNSQPASAGSASHFSAVAGTARACSKADRLAAFVLLPRNVSSPTHDRAELCRMDGSFAFARVLDGRLALGT